MRTVTHLEAKAALKKLAALTKDYPPCKLANRRAEFTARLNLRLSTDFAALMPDDKAENIAVSSASGTHTSFCRCVEGLRIPR